ncbi:MAG: hypothetical protein GQ527_02280 [Bacteroidales bacterium]|nr:hypothetical protein [Bacteroidales bacterium]
MSLLLESIQILNGKPLRLDYHNDRLNRSRNQLMCSHDDIYLEDYLQIPDEYSKGKVKCRILYGQDISKIEFEPYKEKIFHRYLLQNTNIDYPFKYSDRSAFDLLIKKQETSNCLILVKDGLITDTTFSNLIFKHQNGNWLTPSKPLLEGTQREYLLDEGVINEQSIPIGELENYTHFMLINALLDFDESRAVSVDVLTTDLR